MSAERRRAEDPADSDFSGERSRWQEASLFARRNWLGALVLLLVALASAGVVRVIGDLDEALRAQCERGNVTRPAQIRTYLDIAAGNRDRAEAWKQIGDVFPPTAEVAAVQVRANRAEARRLARDADVLAGAQREVALYPRAKDPARRALVDCASEFG